MSKSWGKSELVEMLEREYPPCLGFLLKGGVESAESNFLKRNSNLTTSAKKEHRAQDKPHLSTSSRGVTGQ